MSSANTISNDRKASIARQLLLQALPGQFHLLVTDLRKLIPSSILTDELISDIESEFEDKNGRSALKSSNPNPTDMVSCSLQSSLEDYIKNHHGKNVLTGVTVSTITPQHYSITIYAERIQLKNHLTASWTSRYTLKLKEHKIIIEGDIHQCVYLFEDANVIMDSRIPLLPITLVCKGDDDVPFQVLRQIQHWEKENIRENLHNILDGLNHGPLKALRRILPLAKRRMDWNFGCHRFVKTVVGNARAEFPEPNVSEAK